jgi:ABC-type branched-subunit amino acid transport system substrate-binding protein
MSPSRRVGPVLLGLVIVLVAGGSGLAQQIRRAPLPPSSSGRPATPTTEPTPAPPADTRPILRIGALLPLSGASAWYGKEMRQGMELAGAEVPPEPKPPGTKAQEGQPADRKARESQASPAKASEAKAGGAAGPAASAGDGAVERHSSSGSMSGQSPGRAGPEPDATPPAEATPELPPPAVRIALDVVDVRPLDVKGAEAGFAKLAGSAVVFTATPTPALAVYPLAAARDVLLIHQGAPSGRFPGSSRILLQLRPSAAARGDTLAAYAWERGIRRLALLAAGDDAGKAARAAIIERWRSLGGSPVADESLSPEAPDLPARLGRVARLVPEAVCLVYQGVELGTVAAALRGAGYAGLILALDDSRAALLAGGPTLGDMIVLSDAFVAEPDSPGAPFAKAYEAKHGHPPTRFAASAYDAVRALAEAARLAAEAGRPVTGGGRLREALLARRTFPSVYGGELSVRDDGSFLHPLALFTVTQGTATFVRYVTPAGQPVVGGQRPVEDEPTGIPTP